MASYYFINFKKNRKEHDKYLKSSLRLLDILLILVDGYRAPYRTILVISYSKKPASFTIVHKQIFSIYYDELHFHSDGHSHRSFASSSMAIKSHSIRKIWFLYLTSLNHLTIISDWLKAISISYSNW